MLFDHLIGDIKFEVLLVFVSCHFTCAGASFFGQLNSYWFFQKHLALAQSEVADVIFLPCVTMRSQCGRGTAWGVIRRDLRLYVQSMFAR